MSDQLLASGGHPFTLASISRPLTQLDNRRPRDMYHEFIIRVQGGLTRRLYSVADGSRSLDLLPNGQELKPFLESDYPAQYACFPLTSD